MADLKPCPGGLFVDDAGCLHTITSVSFIPLRIRGTDVLLIQGKIIRPPARLGAPYLMLFIDFHGDGTLPECGLQLHAPKNQRYSCPIQGKKLSLPPARLGAPWLAFQ